MTTWINPNDKTQAKYLPHIGEPCLFAPSGEHAGRVYYGYPMHEGCPWMAAKTQGATE